MLLPSAAHLMTSQSFGDTQQGVYSSSAYLAGVPETLDPPMWHTLYPAVSRFGPRCIRAASVELSFPPLHGRDVQSWGGAWDREIKHMAKDVLKPPVSPGVEPLTHPTTPMGRTPNVRGSCRNGTSQDASFDGPSPFGEPPAAEAGEADLADAQSAWALHQGQLCACREARAAAPAEAGQALQGPPPLVKKGRARVDNVQTCAHILYIMQFRK